MEDHAASYMECFYALRIPVRFKIFSPHNRKKQNFLKKQDEISIISRRAQTTALICAS